jgi:uncharacterized membrane protein
VDLKNVKEQMSFYLVCKNTYFRSRLKEIRNYRLQLGICNLISVISSFGTVAEWLGRGLQNLLQQFESARYLKTRCLTAGFYVMLTNEDEKFLEYWGEQRRHKRPFFGMAFIGLRLGMFIAVGLALSLVAATYSRKANPVLENYSSLVITVIIAGLGIVLFITYFTGQHKWDQNETHYQELLYKKQQEQVQANK